MQRKSRLALTTTAILAAASAQAASIYWTGDQDQYWSTLNTGNSNWSTSSSSNVELARAPLSTDDVKFYASGATNLSTAVYPVSGTMTANSLEVLSTATSAITIAGDASRFLGIGSGGLTVGSGAGQLTITARAASTFVNQTWTNNSSNSIRIGYIFSTNAEFNLAAGTVETITGASMSAGTWRIQPGATFKKTGGSLGGSGGGITLSLEGGTFDAGGTGAIIGVLKGPGGTFANFGVASPDLALYGVPGGSNTTFGGSIPNTVRQFSISGLAVTGANTTTLALSGQSQYTSSTLIAGSSGKTVTVQLVGGNDRLPVGTTVSLGLPTPTATTTGRIILGDASSAVNQTVGGLLSYANSFNVMSVVGGNANTSTLTVNNTSSNNTSFYGVLGGVGTNENKLALTKSNTGTLALYGINTYAGDTTVNGGTLALADNAGLKFYVGASGVNNRITGSGIVTLDGDFTLDLTNASQTVGASWTLVGVSTLNETFGGTFTVNGFTENANLWTLGIDAGKKYEFSEATGVLSVVAIPEPISMLSLVAPALLLRRRKGFGVMRDANASL